MIKNTHATIQLSSITPTNKHKNYSALNPRQFMPIMPSNFKASTQNANRHNDDIRVLY